MPLFKKSSIEMGVMSDSHRKVLRRCRMILIKDMDIQEITDILVQDDLFKPELREYLYGLPNREQRVGIFLDKLETKSDRAFLLFMEVLKENYKHLHYVMNESLKNMDELHDSEHRERVAITGDTVRKLLKNNMRRKVNHSHGSESAEDLDLYFDDKDDGQYIDCYAIPMRGKLQKETWIKQVSEPKSASSPVKSSKDETYMAAVTKDIIFKKINFEEIPEGVKRPPIQCGEVYIVDDEKQDDASSDSADDADTEQEPAPSTVPTLTRKTNEIPLELAPPPPLPPKPGILPPGNSTPSRGARPPSLKARASIKKEKSSESKSDSKPGPEVKLPPRNSSKTKLKDGSDKSRPSLRVKTTKKEDNANDLVPQESPPLPPRLPSKLPPATVPPPVPPTIPPRRQEPGAENGSEEIAEASTEDDQSSAQTLTNEVLPPKDSDDPDADEDMPEEAYEAVNQNLMVKTPPSNNSTSKDNKLEKNPSTDSKPEETDFPLYTPPRSRESTPADRDTGRDQSTQDESSKASADSMDGSLTAGSVDARSITTDSGVEATTPLPPIPPDSRKDSRGSVFSSPRNLSDVQVLAGDISSDSDSYYEDIDVDQGKQSSTSASSPSRTSLMYLDPRSYAKSFDKLEQEQHKRASIKKKVEPDWESMGKFKLPEGILVIAEPDVAFSQSQSDSATASIVTSTANSATAATSDKVKSPTSGTTAATVKLPTSAATPATVKLPTAAATAGTAATSDKVKSPSSASDKSDVKSSATSETMKSDDTEGTASICEDDPPPLSKFIDTVIVFDKVGRVFYIPKSLLHRHGSPEGKAWYYPIEISSRQATMFLSGEKQEGCFLVYTPINRASGAVYNLSVCRANGDVVHYHILENLHGDVMVEGHDHSFLNIQDLVEYFKKNKSQLATRLGRPLKEAKLQVTPGYHYDTKWEVNRSHLTLTGKIIGKGNFGVVCAGMYHNIPVAVKVLQKVDASIEEEDEFIEEASTLMDLRHDHVVRLVGVSCVARPFFLVTEYVPKGNLRDCLQNNDIPKDNMDTMFDICIQTAAAMSYLEERQYILHRDLAARNFLVTEDLCVKLADFGRARYVSDDYYQAPKTEKIAVKWAAPEVLLESSYSTKSDAWALGIVFWEIFSGGEKPYEGLSGEHTAIYVTEGGRLDKPPGCAPDIFSMMKSCWRDSPDDRPSFAVLYDKLKSKSSIYYSREPLRAGPRQQRARVINDVPLPRSTSSSSRQSRGSGGEKDATKDSPVPKHKPNTPTVKQPPKQPPPPSRRTESRTEEYYGNQVLGNIQEEPKVPPRSGALHNSSSETSLVSTGDLLDKDDLTRGNKIRKSLRKIMHMKPRRKTQKFDSLGEWNQQDNGSGDYGPS